MFDGWAGFGDTLSVEGYTGSGFVQYGLSGERVNWGGHTEQIFLNGTLFSGPIGSPVLTPLIPIVGGVPFKVSLGYYIFAFSLEGEGIQVGGIKNTVYLDSVYLFDNNMKPLTGFTLTAASGTQYAAPGEVPEPSAILLSLTVLVISAMVLRRTRRAGLKASNGTYSR
jgi:hypothetical protein